MKVFFSPTIRRQTQSRWLLLFLLTVVLASQSSAGQSVTAKAQTPAAPTPAPGARQGPPRRSGSDRGQTLTGRVVEEGGQPIAEASVIATPAGVASSSSSLAALKVRTGLTDETGKFVIDGLAPGAFTLTSFLPGYVSAAGSPGQPVYYRPGESATLQMVKGGVITGVVTSFNGEPITGIRVRAMQIKDAKGGPARAGTVTPLQLFQEWKTDDRGVYRIFGLDPGSYLVSVGGRGVMNFLMQSVEGYDNDAPTYYPSATRDTALEVAVRSGEVASGIDIRFREGRGHAISGEVSGKVPQTADSGLAVILTQASTGGVQSFSIGLFSDTERSFQFDSVPDGQYDVVAMLGQGDDTLLSRPRRVEVKGTDVTGVQLELGPLGSIAGRLVFEKALAADTRVCPPRSNPLNGEIVILAKLDGKGKEVPTSVLAVNFSPSQMLDGVPDEKGEFKIRPLETGRYRLHADLPGETSFIRAITLPPSSQAAKPIDAARNGIDLKPGERIAGVTVSVAEGAAAISGRVVPSKTGASLPSNLLVHLVPAEKEADDEVLRFFEAPVDREGAFSFKHIAPGRYFLLAKEEPESESNVRDHQPEAWRGTTRRAKLRRDAETFNVPIQLSQCQRVTSQVLRYAPPQSAITLRQ